LPERSESYRESVHMALGEKVVTVDTRPAASACRFADVRFPELYRALERSGAQWLIVPAAFTATTGAAPGAAVARVPSRICVTWRVPSRHLSEWPADLT
jgi:nitrilase